MMNSIVLASLLAVAVAAPQGYNAPKFNQNQPGGASAFISSGGVGAVSNRGNSSPGAGYSAPAQSVGAGFGGGAEQGFGGGAQGFGGVAAQGYEGSRAQGFGGSGSQGFGGSGAQGYEGSSAQGFGGSSAQGFGGSGAQGFGGSGAQGFGGNGAQGFGGSGAQNFGGGSSGQYDGGNSLPSQPCSDGLVRNLDGSCVEPIINRQIFVYAAPPQKIRSGPPPPLPKPKINYNIVFVRTPELTGGIKPVVIPPPQQKTLVYVLNKRPDALEQEIIEVPTIPSEPEVYFINYEQGDNPQLPGGIDLREALSQSVQQGRVIDSDDGAGVGLGGDLALGGGYNAPDSSPEFNDDSFGNNAGVFGGGAIGGSSFGGDIRTGGFAGSSSKNDFSIGSSPPQTPTGLYLTP